MMFFSVEMRRSNDSMTSSTSSLSRRATAPPQSFGGTGVLYGCTSGAVSSESGAGSADYMSMKPSSSSSHSTGGVGGGGGDSTSTSGPASTTGGYMDMDVTSSASSGHQQQQQQQRKHSSSFGNSSSGIGLFAFSGTRSAILSFNKTFPFVQFCCYEG